MKTKELLNKKLEDVSRPNSNRTMWFINISGLEGWYLEDEEKDGDFSYWHIYNGDDEHMGTISVENGVITQLPGNLSENEKDQEEYIKKQLQRVGEEPTSEEMANIMTALPKNLSENKLFEEVKRMKQLAGIISETTSKKI
jgi:hypothetical protein